MALNLVESIFLCIFVLPCSNYKSMYLDIRKGKDRRFYIMQGFRVKGGGTSTKVYMKLGKESDIKEKYGCADAEAWARQKLKTRVRDKNFMIFNQAKDNIEYWAAFQGRLIYLYSLVLLIPEDKLPV